MKLIFITGSSSGLGKALAELFLEENNCSVIGISRTQSVKHPNYEHVFMDLSKEEEYLNFKFPSFDGFSEIIFINNAATVSPVKPIGKLKMGDVLQAYHLNILSPIFFINLLKQSAALPRYILNISSGAANYPIESWGIYCSTKSALNAFSKVAQKENPTADFNVRCISPGIIDTTMQEHIRSTAEKDFPEVTRFKSYKENDELASAETTAKKIIRNFKDFYKSQEILLSLKDF